MNIPLIVGAFLGYMPGMFMVLWGITLLHKKLVIQRKAEKAAKKKTAANLPEPLWPKWWERITFTLKDTRVAKLGRKPKETGPTNKVVFFSLMGLGLLLVLAGAFTKMFILMAGGYCLFFVAIGFSLKSAKDVIESRKKLLNRLYEVGAAKSLFKVEAGAVPGNYVKVLEWRDLLTPQKVEYHVQTSFSASGSDGFMELYNQIFGGETTWVPSTGEGEGWNFQEGKLVINAVPPLPQKAPWDEHYVLDPAIAWSFFPIALGVENGVELKNPKTGEVENVLGFDLSGEQASLGKKMGVPVADAITTSPMCLCSGGTGGGKSLASETPIYVMSN